MAMITRMLEQMGLLHAHPSADSVEPVASRPVPGVADAATRLAPPGPPLEPSPPVPSPPSQPLDLAAEAAVEAAALRDDAADYPVEKVYAAAGLASPEHAFTVDTLVEMMAAEELKDLDPPTRAKVITGMLRRLPSGPVDLKDIAADAARRDQALDAFERFLADRLARAEGEVAEANRLLQHEVDELVRRNTELMEANQRRVEDERSKLERWRERKRAEEQRLYDAVQPFVDVNPVSL